MRQQLDTFDEAFTQLLRRESFDRAFAIACKLNREWRHTALWGPEVILFATMMKRKYHELTGEIVKRIIAAFNVKDEAASVDTRKVKVLRKLLSAALEKFWEAVEPEATVLFEQTQRNAIEHCVSQQGKKKLRVKKQPRTTITQAEWEAYVRHGSLHHLRGYVEDFDKNIISPELDRLLTIAATNPRIGTVDRADLEKRLTMFDTKVGYDLETMSDIQIGRAWNWTAIELAHQSGVPNYQIVAEMDNKTCSVCLSLHGKMFSVEDVYDKMTEEVENAEERVHFPSFAEVDNKSPEEVSKLGLRPPFHPHCRCEIVLRWTKPSIRQYEERATGGPVTDQLDLFPREQVMTTLAQRYEEMHAAQQAVNNLGAAADYLDKTFQTDATYAIHDALLEKKAAWIDAHDLKGRRGLRNGIVDSMIDNAPTEKDTLRDLHRGFDYLESKVLLDLQRNGLRIKWEGLSLDGGYFDATKGNGEIHLGYYSGWGKVRGAISHELAHAVDVLWSHGSRTLKSPTNTALNVFSSWNDPLYNMAPADATKFRALFKKQCDVPYTETFRGNGTFYNGTWARYYDARNYHALGEFVGEEFFSQNCQAMAMSCDEALNFDRIAESILGEVERAKQFGQNTFETSMVRGNLGKAVGQWLRGELSYEEARLQSVLTSTEWQLSRDIYPELASEFENHWFKDVFDRIKIVENVPKAPDIKNMKIKIMTFGGNVLTTAGGVV